MESTLKDDLGILRVTVETQLVAPALVVVTSATDRDGAADVALGLARAFASAGRRTALLRVERRDGATAGASRTTSGLNVHCGPLGGGLDSIDLSWRRAADDPSSEALNDLAKEVRQSYDATIVDAGRVTTSSVGLQLAACADGVLLAVRLGRGLVGSDHAVMPLLGRVGARVIGTVTTTAASERRFTGAVSGSLEPAARAAGEPLNAAK
jgi:Mrp family chromosome partitioning ATPase